MILYNPISRIPHDRKVFYRPKHCFIMTKLGEPIPEKIIQIQRILKRTLEKYDIKQVDALSYVSGKDLNNIQRAKNSVESLQKDF